MVSQALAVESDRRACQAFELILAMFCVRSQDAAIRISQLLANCTDAQRLYLQALGTYRSSLKEIMARETALRTVVRDREILVNRLIKVGNKKPKEGHEREHEMKLEDAQRELQACESESLKYIRRLSSGGKARTDALLR